MIVIYEDDGICITPTQEQNDEHSPPSMDRKDKHSRSVEILIIELSRSQDQLFDDGAIKLWQPQIIRQIIKKVELKRGAGTKTTVRLRPDISLEAHDKECLPTVKPIRKFLLGVLPIVTKEGLRLAASFMQISGGIVE